MNIFIENEKPNIIILGDIMLDYNLKGYSSKIANEGPIPVINIQDEVYSIGGCGNVLLNILALGAKHIHLFSRIGNDDNGKKLQSILPQAVINNLIIDNDYPTITKTRIYADKKIVARYDKEEIKSITAEQEQFILSNIITTITTNNITSVVFSDYNKGVLTKSLCQNIIKICNDYNIPTIIDPKCDYTKYYGCTIIKPNIIETKNIFKVDLNITSLEESHKTINLMLNCKLSVITLSGDGISAYDNTHYRVSETTKDVIDVTGAGDIVCAVLGTYFPFIKDTNLLISIANHLASISVSHLGVYTVNDDDIINTYKYLNKSKQLSIDVLSKLNLNDVVFTNGCFDILHSAHIALFKFCKTLGKTVIVGLNSDNSIKRLKGQTRPIYTLQDRINILESIGYIDYIIPFDEDTPLELIKQIKPTYLVKGGDYSKDNIVGKEYAKDVIIFNYIDNISTTNTIMKIRHNTT